MMAGELTPPEQRTLAEVRADAIKANRKQAAETAAAVPAPATPVKEGETLKQYRRRVAAAARRASSAS